MAAIAASVPLLPCLPPLRSTACCMLLSVKHTKDHGTVVAHIQVFNSLCCGTTYKIEMFGLSLYYAAYGYNGIDLLLFEHFLAPEGQFKTSGHIPPNDIFGQCPAIDQRLPGAIKSPSVMVSFHSETTIPNRKGFALGIVVLS